MSRDEDLKQRLDLVRQDLRTRSARSTERLAVLQRLEVEAQDTIRSAEKRQRRIERQVARQR